MNTNQVNDGPEQSTVESSSAPGQSCTSSEAIMVVNDEDEATNDMTTNMETFMNILKVNLGTGILNAGSAFSYGGLYLSPVLVLFFGCCILYTMVMLLEVAQYARARYIKKYISFPDLHIYLLEPIIGRKAEILRKLVIFSLVVCQYGCCCVYLLFVAESIMTLQIPYVDDIKIILIFLTVLVIPFSLIQKLNYLAIISTIANLICAFCLISTVVGVFLQTSNNSSESIGPINKIPIFISSVVFAFEGIGSVLPMEHKAKEPRHYQPLLISALVISFLMYLFMGFIGYYVFGTNIQASITMNLPNIMYFKIIRILYAVGIFLSLFIQLYVGVDVVLPGILSFFKNTQRHRLIEHLTRIFGAVLSGVFSICIPKLNLMIGLVGSITSSSLTFILPSLLHLAMTFTMPSKSINFYFNCVKDIAFMVLGIAVSVIGLYCSILEIIDYYQS